MASHIGEQKYASPAPNNSFLCTKALKRTFLLQMWSLVAEAEANKPRE